MKIQQRQGKKNFKDLQKDREPKEIFQNLEKYTDLVIYGIQPSMLITGMPGLGKTYLVKKRLENAGLTEVDEVGQGDFKHVKGRATPAGMFTTLFENRDKIIVFDDCDSVFKNEDSVNILKGALDSYDTREISYISNTDLKTSDGLPIPNSFEFTGSVIFISNLEQENVDPALKSRSFVVDISLTPEQMLDRMNELLPDLEPSINLDKKKEALVTLKDVYEKFENVELNMRSLIKAIKIREAGFEDWETMVAEQCVKVTPQKKKKGPGRPKKS